MSETKIISLGRLRIITIATAMGFRLDYDQYMVTGKEWIRFVLADSKLDEPDLRLIWYRDDSLENGLMKASNILFKAGQKKKVQQLNMLEPLI